MESCEIKITVAAQKYGNLNIRQCGRDFFPPDVYGSSARKKGIGVPITLKVKGLSKPVKTDIPTDTSTGRPRWLFRERTWVREFINRNNLAPGNIVTIRRIGTRTYELTADNGNRGVVKKEGSTKKVKTQTAATHDRPLPIPTDSDKGRATKFPKKLLNINCSRTCNCKASHINCLTPKEWLKSQLGVWQFTYESRDVRNKNIHPATFPIALARKLIELFTHQGELVLDPFVGSGTMLNCVMLS